MSETSIVDCLLLLLGLETSLIEHLITRSSAIQRACGVSLLILTVSM